MRYVYFLLLFIFINTTVFSQNDTIYRFESEKKIEKPIVYISDDIKDSRASDSLNIAAYLNQHGVFYFDELEYYDFEGFFLQKKKEYSIIHYDEGHKKNIVDPNISIIESSRVAWLTLISVFLYFFFLSLVVKKTEVRSCLHSHSG